MLTGCLVLGAAAVFFAADNPKLPPPFATPSVRNTPKVIPQPAGAKLNVPAGFTMEIWAEGFKTPRYMMLGPSNEILMTDETVRDAEKQVKRVKFLRRTVHITRLGAQFWLACDPSLS